MCIECSVKRNISVQETFKAAQEIVRFPLSPLMDKSSKDLTDRFKKALTSIFRSLDSDFDGFLCEDDFYDFYWSRILY